MLFKIEISKFGGIYTQRGGPSFAGFRDSRTFAFIENPPCIYTVSYTHLLKITSQRFKQTMVVITHNEEIAQTADRIVRIEDGKIIKDHLHMADQTTGGADCD